jgi:hypothetical protein
MYLDDWLVKNRIRELLLHQLNQTIQLLVDLGLIINLDKCKRPYGTVSMHEAMSPNSRKKWGAGHWRL